MSAAVLGTRTILVTGGAGFIGCNLVDRLVRAGFVERRPSSTDKRSVELVPTGAALGDTGPLLTAAQEQIDATTAELSPDEAETVTRFLTKMRETVDRIASERTARPKRT